MPKKRRSRRKRLPSTSPIQRCPPEILSHIFLMVGGKGPLIHAEWTRRDVRFESVPGHLSQVCRHWWMIILSTPQLWSSMSFELQANFSVFSATKAAQCIDTWISRSGSCPLSVTLQIYGSNVTLSHPILQSIQKGADRWECLDLDIPNELLTQLFHGVKHSLSLLKRLHLRKRWPLEGWQYDGLQWDSDAFAYAPLLRDVQLPCYPTAIPLPLT